ELTRDAKTLLLPASDVQIRHALESLKSFRLLQGFRGKPAADVELVVSTIRALVDFAASHHASLLEMDINPLMITPRGCIVADVLIRESKN
ncbi:MAG: CoA-binding protein, partial [Gammaproteobacteria bacterium]|nr:CoA-binding protein [Gammaproteobacteria bacterium]